jgi:hypothetical protein
MFATHMLLSYVLPVIVTNSLMCDWIFQFFDHYHHQLFDGIQKESSLHFLPCLFTGNYENEKNLFLPFINKTK